ncbi:hypothetical protein KGF41_15450 [Clostridioides sp. ZZV14-6150]|uniref:hypothetical protein n=1 Tax=Clostridioides sp. ZZV14-6150 TaxID=2811493 RepID=UPI001D118DEF|nr:hypothetical protein [Clostridioides sp. ZZV14-6150]
MTKQEKDMWIINIENAAGIVYKKYGSDVAKSIFQRYGVNGIYNLSPCYYSEVFGDLELMANDN